MAGLAQIRFPIIPENSKSRGGTVFANIKNKVHVDVYPDWLIHCQECGILNLQFGFTVNTRKEALEIKRKHLEAHIKS